MSIIYRVDEGVCRTAGKVNHRPNVYKKISRGNEVGLLDSKNLAARPAGEGDTTVVRVHGGSWRVTTRTRGWLVRRKQWTNIPKSYVVDIQVDLFWARQPRERAYVPEMYDVTG